MIKTSLELALLVLVVELAVLAGALLFVFMRTARRKEAQVKADATALVQKVEISDTGRREALTTIFKNTYKFGADEADAAVSQFVERERAFYNFLLAVHLGRGGKKLTDVPNELAKVVAPWLRVTPKNDAAIDGLTQEKTRLETELNDTKRVMEELLAEYSAAFRKGEAPLTLDKAAGAKAAPDDGLLSMDDAIPPPAAVPPVVEPPVATAAQTPDAAAVAYDDAFDLGDMPPSTAIEAAPPEAESATAEAGTAEPSPAHHGLDFDIGDESEAPTAVLPDGGTADMSCMTEADIDALIESLDQGTDDKHAA